MSSTAARRRNRREKEQARLLRRLNSPRPDLPILRTSERRQNGLAPGSSEASLPIAISASPNSLPLVGRAGEGVEPLTTPTSNSSPNRRPPASSADRPLPATDNEQPTTDSPSHHLRPSASSADGIAPNGNPLPEWTRILPLPPNLDPAFRSWLYRHIQTAYAPNTSDEQLLAARIALALARLHLSATREAEDQPNPLWLRYETLADRQFRAAVRDWNAHKKAHHPAPTNAGSPPSPPMINAPIPPKLPGPTFVTPQISTLDPSSSHLPIPALPTRPNRHSRRHPMKKR